MFDLCSNGGKRQKNNLLVRQEKMASVICKYELDIRRLMTTAGQEMPWQHWTECNEGVQILRMSSATRPQFLSNLNPSLATH